MKVFIIDDDQISIFFTERSILLEGNQFIIQTFLSAEDALELLREVKSEELPDIIFLDLNMPTMDGWEFLEEFKQLPQVDALENCQIYILTSSLDTSDMNKAEEDRFVKGFIHKPIDQEDIAVILQTE